MNHVFLEVEKSITTASQINFLFFFFFPSWNRSSHISVISTVSSNVTLSSGQSCYIKCSSSPFSLHSIYSLLVCSLPSDLDSSQRVQVEPEPGCQIGREVGEVEPSVLALPFPRLFNSRFHPTQWCAPDIRSRSGNLCKQAAKSPSYLHSVV